MRQIIGALNPCLIGTDGKKIQWQVILSNAVDPAITLPQHIDNAISLLLKVSLSRGSVRKSLIVKPVDRIRSL